MTEIETHESWLADLSEWEEWQSKWRQQLDPSFFMSDQELEVAIGDKFKVKPSIVNPIRHFFYGGAIRGGKTYVCIAILVLLAKIYPKSRWHIIRKSFPVLKNTSIKSMEQILAGANVRWKRSAAEYFVEFDNGSRIEFMHEGYDSDKEGDKFLGMETNGILFEQLEELQEQTFDLAKSRIGSWRIDHMPPAISLSTFNPTYNWVKKKYYDRWRKDGTDSDEYFLEAFPTDNAYVSEDQWRIWDKMAPDLKARLIKGDWDVDFEGTFIGQFDKKRHLDVKANYNKFLDLWISFDFNVEPMTATLHQTDYKSYCRTIKEYRIDDSNTPEMCAAIRRDFPDIDSMQVKVTGDATGAARNSLSRVNHYDIVHEALNVPWDCFVLAKSNPNLSDSRMVVNSFLATFPDYAVNPETCEYLIEDFQFVLWAIDLQGKLGIEKTGLNKYANVDNKTLGHLLDTWRYFIHAAFPDYIVIPKS